MEKDVEEVSELGEVFEAKFKMFSHGKDLNQKWMLHVLHCNDLLDVLE